MNHYPLVCDPARLEGAECRINMVPRLSYGWAIRYADIPLKPRRPRCHPDQAARLEYLSHRNRSMAAHPDYGGAFDGFVVTSDSDGGL